MTKQPFTLFVFFLVLFHVTHAVSAAPRPNVILIMTDDQGYGELSVHGNPVLKTPHLDQLHAESVRFTDFHVEPMCTPTRGQLMTGLDAARNGAINVSSGRTLLRAELPTMADFFAANGYKTGIFGKWHLGDNTPYRPSDRGFQETLWFPSSHISSLPDFWDNDYFDDVYVHNGKRVAYQGYCTDVFFREAMAWMKKQAALKKPFFAYIPTNAPHGPHWAPRKELEEAEAALEGVDFPRMGETARDAFASYLGMIINIDNNMGRLVSFLKEQGLERNTILIFLTDNGSTFGHLYFNAGMRGRKTELWEGGHRVPLFMRWPDGGFVARDVSGLTQVQDVLPTLIDLAGLITPVAPKLDGISLGPVLRGQADVPEDRMLVINYSRMPFEFEYPSPDSPSIMRREGSAVLWKRWRLLEGRELYDLATDPLQQENVVSEHPSVAKRMREHLDQWWSEVRDTANEPQAVTIGSDAENPMMLSACEWLDVFVDQQGQARKGVRKNGYWHINVDQAGTYELELRRWPREANTPLAAAAPSSPTTAGGTRRAGVALPIARARILIDGIRMTTPVEPGDMAAVFQVELSKGPTLLHTWFEDQEGEPIVGAYYVYVHRK